MTLSKEAATGEVQKQSVSDKRDFNYYSTYDWSVWMFYGTSAFKSDQQKESDITPSLPFTSTNVSQSATVDAQAIGQVTPSQAKVAPKAVNKILPRESSTSEKLFFESAERVLINAGGSFLLGSNLAYIIESNTKREGAGQRQNPFHPNPEEFIVKNNEPIIGDKMAVPFAQRKTSTIPAAVPSGYRQAVNAELIKPAVREVEERAMRVAREGAQIAALAAAFTVVLEVNDKYLERKRDYLTFLTAGGLAGLTYGLLHRPFSPIATIQRSLVLGGVGVVYSFAEKHLVQDEPSTEETNKRNN